MIVIEFKDGDNLVASQSMTEAQLATFDNEQEAIANAREIMAREHSGRIRRSMDSDIPQVIAQSTQSAYDSVMNASAKLSKFTESEYQQWRQDNL